MFKVSVIVPVFNVSQYLPRFFNSLKKQKLSDVEYILVDDGSTDNSLQLCYKFQHEMNNVRVFHHENIGVGPTRNIGLENARGKYIYFCDPDDTIDNSLLSDNYYLAEKYKADLIIFGFDALDVTGKITNRVKLNFQFCKNKNEFISFFPSLCHDLIINYLWNKFYLREKIQHLKFEDVRTGEDIRFNTQAYDLVTRVLINDKLYYHYLQGRPNSSQIERSISDIYLYLQEDKIIENLFFNVWNKKNNLQFKEIVKRRYQYTGNEILLMAESQSNYIKKYKVLKIFDSYHLEKYFDFRIKDGLIYNYKVLVFKLRYVPFVLSVDKILRNLKNNRFFDRKK